MPAFSNSLRNFLFALLLLCYGCQSYQGPPITLARFEKLLVNEAVTKVIVVSDKGYVEVHLDKEKLKNIDASGLEDSDICTIEGVEREYFIKKYDELVSEAGLTNAPLLRFESRPNLMDFFAGYGLLLILICAFLFLAIILPLRIVSQKKKIRDLEDRIRSLEQKDN